jgi:hypothetical protein
MMEDMDHSEAHQNLTARQFGDLRLGKDLR